MSVRAINRPGSQLLGANGRDDGPIVSFFPIQMLPFCYSYIFMVFHVLIIFMKSLFACTHTDVGAVDGLITLNFTIVIIP